jgi:hypothetical protein
MNAMVKAGDNVAGATDNVVGAGAKAADDVVGAGGKVAGATDNVAGAGAKAADNVLDDAAKAAAAAEAKAASKAGKLRQWAKANPKKAVAIGLIAAGTGAYVGNRVFGGDDGGQGPSPAPVTPVTPVTPVAPVTPPVDTTAIENEITALISELENQPECQKELAVLKQQLAGLTGKKESGQLAGEQRTPAEIQASKDLGSFAGESVDNELARWLKIARG